MFAARVHDSIASFDCFVSILELHSWLPELNARADDEVTTVLTYNRTSNVLYLLLIASESSSAALTVVRLKFSCASGGEREDRGQNSLNRHRIVVAVRSTSKQWGSQ
jgi:hypothetical protein